MTTEVPFSTSASPSPVSVLTPVLRDAATASCPCSRSLLTSFDPMSPVPPITTIFIIVSFVEMWAGVFSEASRCLASQDLPCAPCSSPKSGKYGNYRFEKEKRGPTHSPKVPRCLQGPREHLSP